MSSSQQSNNALILCTYIFQPFAVHASASIETVHLPLSCPLNFLHYSPDSCSIACSSLLFLLQNSFSTRPDWRLLPFLQPDRYTVASSQSFDNTNLIHFGSMSAILYTTDATSLHIFSARLSNNESCRNFLADWGPVLGVSAAHFIVVVTEIYLVNPRAARTAMEIMQSDDSTGNLFNDSRPEESSLRATDIPTLLKLCNVSEEAIAQAFSTSIIRSRENKTVYDMVAHHRTMSDILVSLGLPSFSSDPKGRGSCMCYGVQLTTRQVLRHFGWSPMTWQNKSQAYSWATASVRQKEWSPSLPVHCREYRVWLGIVFLFKEGGAIEKKNRPTQYGLRDEKHAYELSQNDLLQPKRSKVDRYLVIKA